MIFTRRNPFGLSRRELKKLEEDGVSIYVDGVDCYIGFNTELFIKSLKKRYWKDYIQEDNIAVAAFLTAMDYHEDEKVDVKLVVHGMLSRLTDVPDIIKGDIYQVTDAVLDLTEEEEIEFLDRWTEEEDSKIIAEVRSKKPTK